MWIVDIQYVFNISLAITNMFVHPVLKMFVMDVHTMVDVTVSRVIITYNKYGVASVFSLLCR